MRKIKIGKSKKRRVQIMYMKKFADRRTKKLQIASIFGVFRKSRINTGFSHCVQIMYTNLYKA